MHLCMPLSVPSLYRRRLAFSTIAANVCLSTPVLSFLADTRLSVLETSESHCISYARK